MKTDHESIFKTSLTSHRAARAALLTCSLSMLLWISTAEVATAQTKTTTDANGNSTTSGSSNEYGEGGTYERTSDKRGIVTREVVRDKCGRVRELYFLMSEGRRSYTNERGHQRVTAVTDKNGETHYEGEYRDPLDPKKGKELVEKCKKTPSAPCDKVDVAPGPPEKPKDRPNPLGKLLQDVNIGIGVSGGRTYGRDDHDHARHLDDKRHLDDHARSTSDTKRIGDQKKTATDHKRTGEKKSPTPTPSHRG